MTRSREHVTLLLTIMRQLEQVMQAENVLLREMRLERLRDLQAEKADLADRYELELRRLRADPELVAALDQEGRTTLEESMRAFRKALRRNAERLAQARGIVDGVIRALSDSLGASGGRAGYGAAHKPPGETGRVVAVAFDRKC
jgi:hypothetical protein